MYGRSKNAAEQVVRQSHLPWVIARPPAVYGPRDSDNFLQVFKLVRSGFAPVFGDGSQELSMVYAPDLARSLELIGTTPGIESRAYFTNHPEIVTTTRPGAPHRPPDGPRRADHSHSASPRRGCCSARPDRWRRLTGQPNDPARRQGARFLLARLDRRPHAADVRDRLAAGARPRSWPGRDQGLVPGVRLAFPVAPPPEGGAHDAAPPRSSSAPTRRSWRSPPLTRVGLSRGNWLDGAGQCRSSSSGCGWSPAPASARRDVSCAR